MDDATQRRRLRSVSEAERPAANDTGSRCSRCRVILINAREMGVEMGPLVSKTQFDRVTGFLRSGSEEGARTVCGGKRHGETGFFVEPTVLDGTSDQMRVYQEEIFGPVAGRYGLGQLLQYFRRIDALWRL